MVQLSSPKVLALAVASISSGRTHLAWDSGLFSLVSVAPWFWIYECSSYATHAYSTPWLCLSNPHPPAVIPPSLLTAPPTALWPCAAQKHGYIGEFELVDDHRSGKIVVELNGRLNKCGVISPRYDIGHAEIEAWIARLLPSRQFGVIVLTTSQVRGVMQGDRNAGKVV